MNKKYLYLLIIALLFFSVPWFFTTPGSEKYFGLPDWGLFSLAATTAFAVITAILIGKYWDKISEEGDSE